MEIRFATKDLERLYFDPRFEARLPSQVVTAFRKRIQTIVAAPDERVFYAMKSLHFEKLQGKRSSQHSMRLNDQWRLILTFDGKGAGKVVTVVAIEDYH